MKKILLFTLLCCASFTYAQKLRFKVDGLKDTTVFLTKYVGQKLFYSDTAISKGGIVEFTAKPDLKPGMLALFMPGQKYFEFIYNKEEISIEATYPDFIPTMKVKKSEENKLFISYIQFLQKERTKANEIQRLREKFKPEDAEYKKYTTQLDSISKGVAAYQNNLMTQNPTRLVSKIIKMSIEVNTPDAPRNDKGQIIDSNFRFKYFRAHFWDNIDLKDDRLVNTPVFAQKLEYFFGKNMMIPQPDTVLFYAFQFCDQFDKKSEMFRFSVDYITNYFAKSKIMGMDKVFVMMVDRYYCARDAAGKSYAHWMSEEKLKELCEDNKVQKNLVFGVKPPNVILLDSTEKVWKDFYSLTSEYTILYFWDPECGHCKKTTPKLQKLYEEKLKARNVEIFAVGKANGEDFEKWKKFIRDNKLSFINVGLTKTLYEQAMLDARPLLKYTTLESLNYHDTYDLYATPRIFVLDKDKKIIGKQLTISQLEDMLDRLQKIQNAPKLFPPDPEDEAH